MIEIASNRITKIILLRKLANFETTPIITASIGQTLFVEAQFSILFINQKHVTMQTGACVTFQLLLVNLLFGQMYFIIMVLPGGGPEPTYSDNVSPSAIFDPGMLPTNLWKINPITFSIVQLICIPQQQTNDAIHDMLVLCDLERQDQSCIANKMLKHLRSIVLREYL